MIVEDNKATITTQDLPGLAYPLKASQAIPISWDRRPRSSPRSLPYSPYGSGSPAWIPRFLWI